MTSRSLNASLFVLVALGLSACSGRTDDSEEPEPIEVQVQVTVENRNQKDVVVYALARGNRVRLGMVGSQATRSFTIESEMTRSTTFQLIADPIGVLEEYRSHMVRIEPGDQIQWTLGANLTHSALFVF